MIIGIVAYKSSWLLLTRTGQVLYFNGGGFDKVTDLSLYFEEVTWGDGINPDAFGDIMQVEGDVIYFNLNNLYNFYGNKSERYLENTPAGILCYDPKVGLYHRYSPSLSKASFITVASGNINTTTNVITKTLGTLPATGNPIKYVSEKASPLGGVPIGTYYIIKHTANTFSLAETYEDAIAGNKVDITSAVDSCFLSLDVEDFGASRSGRTGAISLLGQQSLVFDHLIFSTDMYDNNSSSNNANISLTISGFENRGYAVTSKILSGDTTDNTQNIIIKYRPLDTTDSIIVKYKDIDVIGIPVTTPQ